MDDRDGDAEEFDLPATLAALDDHDPSSQRRAVAAIRSIVDEDPLSCVPTVPKLRALLGRPSIDFHGEIVYCLAELAAESPGDVAPSCEAIVSFLRTTDRESSVRRTTFRCLANVASERPEAVLDHVDPIVDALADAPTDEGPDPWGIYLLSTLSAADSRAIAPAQPVLVDALESDPETCGPAALSALGRLVGADATASLSFVDRVVDLIDHERDAVRNNAIGCLGDVARWNPSAVEDACPRLAPALDVDDPRARTNAAIAIARVAAGAPDAVRPARSRLYDRLEDDEPAVRENACVALARGDAVEAYERIESLAAADPNAGVRERAAEALADLDRLTCALCDGEFERYETRASHPNPICRRCEGRAEEGDGDALRIGGRTCWRPSNADGRVACLDDRGCDTLAAFEATHYDEWGNPIHTID